MQFCIMCSTMRLIFNLYSTFNALFNIQLRIQHSTIHFIFNSLFTHSIIYSTISTIHSTFNYSFNSFEPSLLLVSHKDHCLLKTWRRRLECRLRKQKLVKMTQGSTSMWSLTFQGFQQLVKWGYQDSFKYLVYIYTFLLDKLGFKGIFIYLVDICTF